MAHNIGKMFYVGERPWHRLGTALPAAVNMHQALKEGGLNYTVSMVPLAVAGEPSSAVPQRMAVVRDDRSAGQVLCPGLFKGNRPAYSQCHRSVEALRKVGLSFCRADSVFA